MDTGAAVAGMRVSVSSVEGGEYLMINDGSDGDAKHISDAYGCFTVKNAPSGRVYLQGVPLDWGDSAYTAGLRVRTAPAGGAFDAGHVKLRQAADKVARAAVTSDSP